VSVQVTYKKQFVLYIFLLLIFLIVVEILVNFWLYNIYRCDFESNEMFKDVDPEINRKMCLDSLSVDFTKERIEKAPRTYALPIETVYDTNFVSINSHGFRGPEIEKNKPENTYRIFAIGGSTTFSSGVLDNQTWPFYLQKSYDGVDLPFKVEVVNAGWTASWSIHEIKKIKGEYMDFSPDLFLVYGGYNDVKHHEKGNLNALPTLWKKRWADICDSGEQYSYDTIVTLQPFTGAGKKILTEQEYKGYINVNIPLIELYPQFKTQLTELENHCTVTADLRGIFDNIREPIYWDYAHTGPKGNQIIAENFFQLSLPLVMKKAQTGINNEDFGDSMIYNTDNKLIQNESDTFSEDFFNSIETILLPYKTPKVFSLIFEE